MTFTWDDTDLSTALSQVRLTIGDTDTNRPLLTDEEITYRLGLHSNGILVTSIDCVKDILAKIARDIDRSGEKVSGTRSQKTQHYKDLLKQLMQDNATLCEAYVGGTSDAEADTLEADDDWRAPGMTIDWGKNNG